MQDIHTDKDGHLIKMLVSYTVLKNSCNLVKYRKASNNF
jgi:hypothetical protein